MKLLTTNEYIQLRFKGSRNDLQYESTYIFNAKHQKNKTVYLFFL